MSMGLLFKVSSEQASAGTSEWRFSGARLPRDTFQVLRQADDVLREAQAEAQRVRAQTAATLEAQKRQAFEQGLAQGRAEGMAQVLGTLEVAQRLRELLAHRLADVVEHGLRGVLAELGEPEVMRQRVLRLLGPANESTALSATGNATLHVHPGQFTLAQEVVARLKASAAHPAHAFAGLKVVADPHRAIDALLLETRVGFIEAELSLSLLAARELLQQSLAQAEKQWEDLA